MVVLFAGARATRMIVVGDGGAAMGVVWKMTISAGGLASVAASLLLLGCHHLRPERSPEWPETAAGPGAGQGYSAHGAPEWSGYGVPAVPSYGEPANAGGGAARPPAPLAPASAGPPQGGALAVRAVSFAQRQLGKPYCYGGTGPGCYDCSGLTYAAWRWAGKAVPRTSSEQHDELPSIPWAAARPGDVVWRPGHVGLYVGDGWVIHSPETGKRVEYEPALKYRRVMRP